MKINVEIDNGINFTLSLENNNILEKMIEIIQTHLHTSDVDNKSVTSNESDYVTQFDNTFNINDADDDGDYDGDDVDGDGDDGDDDGDGDGDGDGDDGDGDVDGDHDGNCNGNKYIKPPTIIIPNTNNHINNFNGMSKQLNGFWKCVIIGKQKTEFEYFRYLEFNEETGTFSGTIYTTNGNRFDTAMTCYGNVEYINENDMKITMLDYSDNKPIINNTASLIKYQKDWQFIDGHWNKLDNEDSGQMIGSKQ